MKSISIYVRDSTGQDCLNILLNIINPKQNTSVPNIVGVPDDKL